MPKKICSRSCSTQRHTTSTVDMRQFRDKRSIVDNKQAGTTYTYYSASVQFLCFLCFCVFSRSSSRSCSTQPHTTSTVDALQFRDKRRIVDNKQAATTYTYRRLTTIDNKMKRHGYFTGKTVLSHIQCRLKAFL